ncbi:MAG: Hsp20/alpha crystallin family protein [Planctomycetes bacterium]|nr:Hsp20/alpha crystallin family protein [Planctomycetota bacterium]MCB9883843.1 Hsp20/alpha crystallin family protein [Planctomycetota bacterium]
MQKTTTTNRLPQLRDPFDNLFGRLFGDALQDFYGTPEQAHALRTNIAENDQGYELSFELPGLDEKAIDVQMHDHTLTVTAERTDDRQTEGKRWHRVEHRYGQLSRSIVLPKDAAQSGIEAVYKHGVLTITVPKAPEARPNKISVRSN